VVKAAGERQIPIRIGSTPAACRRTSTRKLTTARKMVAAAMRHIKLLEDLDFDLIKVSLKAFDVPTTIEAYRDIADKNPYPLTHRHHRIGAA
jgi:(E)-4-hydroxy-3-methylbut-2-enyl-diphosphate synthase